MAKILVVYYSVGGNTKAAAEALVEGARGVAGAEVVLKSGLDADTDDLLSADAVAFGTGDYFGTMLGGLKDFFDRTYYACKDKVTDTPCALFVTHGGGGKAVESLQRMAERYKLRVVGAPVLVKDAPDAAAIGALAEAGRQLAAAAK